MHNIKVILTEDGSHSLYLPELNETYHSFHGAIQESLHVYIQNGYHHVLRQPGLQKLAILEVGFGTGLNVLLTMAEAFQSKTQTSIVTLEPFPLPQEIVNGLNYARTMPLKYPDFNYAEAFHSIHAVTWNGELKVSEHVMLKKIQVKLQDFIEIPESFDLIYFDAFAPLKQPDLWLPEIFIKLHNVMKKGGILVSYCAQGQFKRNLKAAGFEVETLKGPPGKFEMVRGRRNQ